MTYSYGGELLDAYLSESPDPVIGELVRRWRRNQRLFDATEGFGMARRDTELALRSNTELASETFADASREWRARGQPERGRHARRFAKTLTVYLKAIEAENREYEGTLLFHGVDPDNDQELAAIQTDAMTNRDAE